MLRPGTMALLALALALAPVGCTSQTAVAIVMADAGPPVSDGLAADTTDVVPVVGDGPETAVPPPDVSDGVVDRLLDLVDAGDASPPADVLFPPDLVEARAEGAPEVARDLAPEAAGRDSGPVVLFSDGFDGGFEPNWQTSESSDGPVTDTVDGSNPIITLDSTQADFTRLRCNLYGDNSPGACRFSEVNITASMRLRVEQAPPSTRSVRLDVRQAAATANVFYAVGAVVASDGTIRQVSIFKKVPDGNGDYTICQLAEGPVFATPIAMNQWKRIKLTISGTNSVSLTAFFEDLQVASFTDDCTSDLTATNNAKVSNGGCLADQTGLGIQVEKGLQASVDDVLVTTP